MTSASSPETELVARLLAFSPNPEASPTSRRPDAMVGTIREAASRIQSMSRQVESLREWVDRYARHDPRCGIATGKGPCSCGLDALTDKGTETPEMTADKAHAPLGSVRTADAAQHIGPPVSAPAQGSLREALIEAERALTQTHSALVGLRRCLDGDQLRSLPGEAAAIIAADDRFRDDVRPAELDPVSAACDAARPVLTAIRSALQQGEGTTRIRATGEWQPTHHHKKRGTEYEVVGNAYLQTDKPLLDMTPMVVYRGHDGSLWVRSGLEFNDGRFALLSKDGEGKTP